MGLADEIEDLIESSEDAVEEIVGAVVDATRRAGMSAREAYELLLGLREAAQTWVDALKSDIGEEG